MKKLFALFLIGLICFVAAHGGDDSTPGSSSGGDDDMDLHPSSENDDSAEFESTFKNVNQDGKLKFKVEVNDHQVRLNLEAYNSASSSERAFRVRIAFAEIVEYTEVNAVDGYQPGVDTAVSTLRASDLQYSNVTCSSPSAGIYTCTVQSIDGQLKVVAFITAAVSSASGEPQKPSSVKFTVDINLANRNVGSRVALVTFVRTEQGETASVHDQSEEERSGFTNTPEHELIVGPGSISWATVAAQNGANITVFNSGPVAGNNAVVTSDDDKDEQVVQMIFSFDTTVAGLISWDPKLLFNGAFAGSAGVISSSLIAVVVAIFFAIVM